VPDWPEGTMVRSVAVADLPDEAAARVWLAEDPTMKEMLWEDVPILLGAGGRRAF